MKTLQGKKNNTVHTSQRLKKNKKKEKEGRKQKHKQKRWKEKSSEQLRKREIVTHKENERIKQAIQNARFGTPHHQQGRKRKSKKIHPLVFQRCELLAIEKWFLGIHETYDRELRGGWGEGKEGEAAGEGSRGSRGAVL